MERLTKVIAAYGKTLLYILVGNTKIPQLERWKLKMSGTLWENFLIMKIPASLRSRSGS